MGGGTGTREAPLGSLPEFAVGLGARNDIAALTHEAAAISKVPHIMDVDQAEAEGLLGN